MALSAFREIRLPTSISLGSTFGPETATEVIALGSGHEGRTVLWPQHRYRADVRYGVRTIAQLQDLYAFFMVSRGKAMGFRVKNHMDYKATAQFVGLGDDETTTFQLLKIYDSGLQADQYVRYIRKPVGVDYPLGNLADTVKLYQDDVLMDGGYGVDYSTGMVTLGTPLALGVTLTWSGEFDIPMRFDTDHLPLSLLVPGKGQTARPIPLVEVLAFPTFPAALTSV